MQALPTETTKLIASGGELSALRLAAAASRLRRAVQPRMIRETGQMRITLLLAAVAALSLAACNQAQTEQAGADAEQAADEAGAAANDAGAAVGEAAHDAGEAVEGAVNDAANATAAATDDNPSTTPENATHN